MCVCVYDSVCAAGRCSPLCVAAYMFVGFFFWLFFTVENFVVKTYHIIEVI